MKEYIPAEVILKLLGSPDAMLRDEWEYDIDKLFTLKIMQEGQQPQQRVTYREFGFHSAL